MTLDELAARIEALGQMPGVKVAWYPLAYHGGDFAFPRVSSMPIEPGDKVLMIGAGVHADETSGPITLARFGPAIIERAHSKRVKLILYPLRNPSGFGIPGKRYNIDTPDREVLVGNNDFLRYRLADGTIVDDLHMRHEFESWGWASDPEFGVPLPLETQLMHELLRQAPLEQVRGVLDLHQDTITPNAPARAYHYAFGRLTRYAPIVRQIEQCVPLWQNQPISAGYAGVNAKGQVTRAAPGRALCTDDNGFIVRHDGSWTDLMHRVAESQGRSIHSVSAETTGITPLDLACRVNLIWVYGLIDLIAEERQGRQPSSAED